MIQGEAINQGISDFKFWFKDFMIEVSPLLAFVGFLMLVADINIRGGLATNMYFEIPWAIVQGIAVEGLLFAVWYHIFQHDGWSWRTWYKHIWPILIGLIMALVGIAMVNIAMFQELFNIADSVQAMARLHIDVYTFMYSRSILVVLTSILAIPFGRMYTPKASKAVHVEQMDAQRVSVETVVNVPELPVQAESKQERSREQIREQVKTLLGEQPAISVRSLAQELDIPTSTANNYMKKLRQTA